MAFIYNLRQTKFHSKNVKTIKYGIETLPFQGAKIWAHVPENIKNAKTLSEFKSKIKRWKPVGCCCKLCKVYIQDIGFL